MSRNFLAAVILLISFRISAADVVGKGYSTRLDGVQSMDPQQNIFSEGKCDPSQSPVLHISPEQKKQSYKGAGAALTEATAILLSEMNPTERDQFLHQSFDPRGLGLNFLRVPIGSTDFSPVHISCDDILSPMGDDMNLQYFDFHRCAGNLVTSLKEILQINPNMHLIASPWSAPAWMKSNGSMIGGTLKKEDQDVYARYLTRFLQEMENQGIHFEYLTVENEPLYNEAWAQYPWMHMEAVDQAEFIGQHLGPALVQRGLKRTKILAFDHNWEHADYPRTVLHDPLAAKYVSGVAFHCYIGVPEEMTPIRSEFPGQEIHMTECAAGGWISSDAKALMSAMDELVIRNFKSGSQSLTYWNLLLDENHGPKNGGCQDCRGIFNIQSATHQISGSPEAIALQHLTAAVDPEASIIGSSEVTGLSQVAFQNVNGDIAWIALNSTEGDVFLQVETAGHCSAFKIPAQSVISTRVGPLPPSRH